MVITDKIIGIVAIFGGVYGLLIAYRIIPVNPKEPERVELWHRKFGKLMKILSPVIIVFGILMLLGVL